MAKAFIEGFLGGAMLTLSYGIFGYLHTLLVSQEPSEVKMENFLTSIGAIAIGIAFLVLAISVKLGVGT